MMSKDDNTRSIGKVIYVASDKLTIELNHESNNFTVVGFDGIHYMASLGAFVIIPVQSEYMVGEIISLREKDYNVSNFQNDNDINLEKINATKYLDVVPIGMLSKDKSSITKQSKFSFGISTFPSLYSNVLHILDEELDQIFGVAVNPEEEKVIFNEEKGNQPKVLSIGKSTVFGDYSVKIKIDDFFGGHIAVLGNTGSGKSCTVSSILQSLFEKKDNFKAQGATFIIFDVNGEYWQALSKLPANVKVRKINLISGEVVTSFDNKIYKEEEQFQIPHWFLSVEEWELLLLASERIQRPILRTALSLAASFFALSDNDQEATKNHILASCISFILQGDMSSNSKSDRIKSILFNFKTTALNNQTIKAETHFGQFQQPDKLLELLNSHIKSDFELPDYIPYQKFDFFAMENAINLGILYEEAHGNRQIRDFCAGMLIRLKSIGNREEFNFMRVSKDEIAESYTTMGSYTENFLGIKNKDNQLYKDSQIIIIDMNEVSDEVVEVASSVLSRLIFEKLKKSEPRNSFPVHLILEEAHRYVSEKTSKYSIDANLIFERIAKEGRKYGMFLEVASQRPSELSKTVLSQCSNFIVHRIQNPDDLYQIRKMTPYISDSILSTLPSLPKQHALIFGNSVNIPTKFKVREVNPMPKSEDAKIRELWFIPPTKAIKWERDTVKVSKEDVQSVTLDVNGAPAIAEDEIFLPY